MDMEKEYIISFELDKPWKVYVFCNLCDDLELSYRIYAHPDAKFLLKVFVRIRKNIFDELERHWDNIKGLDSLKDHLDKSLHDYFIDQLELGIADRILLKNGWVLGREKKDEDS
jgi:hypothetical protein